MITSEALIFKTECVFTRNGKCLGERQPLCKDRAGWTVWSRVMFCVLREVVNYCDL